MTPQSEQAESARALLDFIHDAPTPYHAAECVVERLRQAGYAEWRRGERWRAADADRGYVRLGDGAVAAIDLGTADVRDGLTILAAHTDSPALRVKEQGVAWRKGYLAVPTELYGGPIVSTWLDRELGIAGRLAMRDGRVRPFRLTLSATIPNLAIHLNRTVNEGFAYNAHDHMVAFLAAEKEHADESAGGVLRGYIAEAAGLSPDDVAEYEAMLFDPLRGSTLGTDASVFASSRIDNLAGCFTNLEAFLSAEAGGARMLALYNHEEIGSRTGEGAESGTVESMVRRLVHARGGDEEDTAVTMERSVVVSNDAAHALHPAYAEKYDPDYAPVLGGGAVLKLSGTYRYATTAASAAAFARACEHAGVPMQRLTNRSDIKSGSTVGPITWARTGMQTVDVGIPLLAMHSIRETAGTADVHAMIRALRSFLELRPQREGD